jgi:hypothetical protein
MCFFILPHSNPQIYSLRDSKESNSINEPMPAYQEKIKKCIAYKNASCKVNASENQNRNKNSSST